MEERKPMYEFDFGLMGKVICSADTAQWLQELVLLASQDARKNLPNTDLQKAYDEMYSSLFDELKSIGYYNEFL